MIFNLTMMVNSIIPLAHLVLVHLDYPWVPVDRRAHFHLSLQVGLALPFKEQTEKEQMGHSDSS